MHHYCVTTTLLMLLTTAVMVSHVDCCFRQQESRSIASFLFSYGQELAEDVKFTLS